MTSLPTTESNEPLSLDQLGDEAVYPLADHGEFLSRGLTKREYFAALALQGAITVDPDLLITDAAVAAVQYADALIEALQK